MSTYIHTPLFLYYQEESKSGSVSYSAEEEYRLFHIRLLKAIYWDIYKRYIGIYVLNGFPWM